MAVYDRIAWTAGALLAAFSLHAFGAAPMLIDYQGMVRLRGRAHDGSGYFKLAISDANGVNLWTHDGSALAATNAPDGFLTNAVVDGVFSILLGDTSLGMAVFPEDLFASGDRYLRLWFATNAVSEFIEMLPSQRMVSTPYALNARTLDGQTRAQLAEALAKDTAFISDLVAAAGFRSGLRDQLWGLEGNAGTREGEHFVGTTDARRLDLRANNVTGLTIAENGRVGIGTPVPAVSLHVHGPGRFDGGIEYVRPGGDIGMGVYTNMSGVSASAYPAWWLDRGVVVTGGVAVANDFAGVNVGQLKWIASMALLEIDAHLPGGAGDAVRNAVLGFSNGDDFAAVNIGQVKNLATVFWDRLIAAGVASAYPWSSSGGNDFAAATVGQLKVAFGFEVGTTDPGGDDGTPGDSDGDGLADDVETGTGIFVDSGDTGTSASSADSDGDGVRDGDEVVARTDPNSSDSTRPDVHIAFPVASGQYIVIP
jgi:hypothetical protein